MGHPNQSPGRKFTKENNPSKKGVSVPGRGKRLVLTELDYQNIETYGGLGLPWKHIASLLGVTNNTLLIHRKKNDRIELAYNKGKAQSAAKVAMAAYHRATIDRSDNMIKWWETTREGRAERTEVKETSERFVISAPKPLTVEEWNEKFGNGPPDPEGEK